MFYRFTKSGLRIPVDLDDIYSGSCFLAGGSPALLKENLSLLSQPGIMTMSMNNTASIVPSSLWVGGDKPLCYSPKILLDPRLLHFAIISRRDFEVGGTPWKHCPNTYFFGTNDNFTLGDLLKPHRDFVWWKNTFYIALQILYRLGFRKIYLIGCEFNIEKDHQYAYGAKLGEEEVTWNKRTYNAVVANMKHLKPHFEECGIEIISATPNSKLNDIYKVMSFDDAVKDVLENFPKEYNIKDCPHSSFFGKNKKE